MIRYAVATGNWSSTNTWSATYNGSSGASVPVAGDVAYANGQTVTIDTNATCLEVRNDNTNSAVAGGRFVLSNGIILTANIYQGSVLPTGSGCVQLNLASPNLASIVGNIYGGNCASECGAVTNGGSGTLNITGNIYGGSVSFSYGIFHYSSGTINIIGNVASSIGVGILNWDGTLNLTGNVTGGTSSYSYGIIYGSGSLTGSATITGNIYGGTSIFTCGLINRSTRNVIVNGNVFGGSNASAYGVINNTTGTITINGNSIGGTTGHGAYNNSTGTIIVNGYAIGNDYGFGSIGLSATPGIYGSQYSITKVKGIKCGSRGQWPTAGNVFVDPTITSLCETRTTNYVARSSYFPESRPFPAVTSVRNGVSYSKGSDTSITKRNLLYVSDKLSDNIWGKTSVTITNNDPIFSSLNLVDSAEFVDSTVNRRILQTISMVNGYTYTLSFYIRKTDQTMPNQSGGPYRDFTLIINGGDYNITSPSNFTLIGDGIYRFYLTFTSNGTAGIYLYKYQGLNTNDPFKCSGFQLEIGSSPTAYQQITGIDLPTSITNSTVTGSCVIPSASDVLVGVPVDHTVGTRQLPSVQNLWTYTNKSLNTTPTSKSSNL